MRKDEKRYSKYVQLGQMIAEGGEQDKHLQRSQLKNVVITKGQIHPWCNFTQVNFSSVTSGMNLAMQKKVKENEGLLREV